MNISVIIVIFVIILIVIVVSVVYSIHKPKTDLELFQAKQKIIEKSIRKNKGNIDKIGEKVDSQISNLLKKNGEMLKKKQDNQHQ